MARTGAAQSGRPLLSLHLLDGSDQQITEGAITEGGTVRYRIWARNIRNYHDWGDPAMLGRVWVRADVEYDRHFPSPWRQSSLDGISAESHISCGDEPLLRVGLSDTQPDFNQTSATTGYWDLETEPFPAGYAEHGPLTLSIQRKGCSRRPITPEHRDPDIGSPMSACVTIADDGQGDDYDYAASNTLQETFDDKPTYSCSDVRSSQSLRGRFVSPPERHDGKKAVDVQVAFSDSVYESEENVGEHGVRVEGGRVTSSKRVGRQPAGSAQAGSAEAGWSAAYATRTAGGGAGGYEYVWEFGVEPDSDGDMTVTLDAGRSCDAPGAICTSDGRSLSAGVSTTVRGPGDGPEENTPAEGAPAISGTPQVGEEFTASASDISDADGLDDASFAYQWIRTDTDIDGATGSTYTVADADEGETLKVRVGFTDDAGNEESLTSAATDAVSGRPEPLTASFEGMPAEHTGDRFTFGLTFSEHFPLSFRTLRDKAFEVGGGAVRKTNRRESGSNVGWTITVEPDGHGAVTIRLPETRDCDARGALCTGDGRPLSHSLSATVAGPSDDVPDPNTPATGAPTIAGTARVGED